MGHAELFRHAELLPAGRHGVSASHIYDALGGTLN